MSADERSDSFCHWRGGQKRDAWQRLRGEPSLLILPLEEARSSTVPALLLTPAKDHGDKPRSRTSDRPSKLQSLSAATRYLPPLTSLCFANASYWPWLKPTSANSTIHLQTLPALVMSTGLGHWQPWLWEHRGCCCPCGLNFVSGRT